jgi:hypothetical protein
MISLRRSVQWRAHLLAAMLAMCGTHSSDLWGQQVTGDVACGCKRWYSWNVAWESWGVARDTAKAVKPLAA